MAAPTPTARQTPVGKRFRNGFRTKVTFAADPDISLWEREVTPMGVDGGEAVDTTTMWNDAYQTKAPRELSDLTDGQMVVAFQEASLTQILAIINVETTITLTYPDLSTEAFFGWLRTFVRNAFVRGTMPTATVAFVSSAWDPAADVEAGPVVAPIAGT